MGETAAPEGAEDEDEMNLEQIEAERQAALRSMHSFGGAVRAASKAHPASATGPISLRLGTKADSRPATSAAFTQAASAATAIGSGAWPSTKFKVAALPGAGQDEEANPSPREGSVFDRLRAGQAAPEVSLQISLLQ
jgi:hypothetical protein